MRTFKITSRSSAHFQVQLQGQVRISGTHDQVCTFKIILKVKSALSWGVEAWWGCVKIWRFHPLVVETQGFRRNADSRERFLAASHFIWQVAWWRCAPEALIWPWKCAFDFEVSLRMILNCLRTSYLCLLYKLNEKELVKSRLSSICFFKVNET